MTNPKAVNFLKKDPVLCKIIKNIGEFRIKIRKNRYKALIEAITYQQLTGFAASAIMNRFTKLYSRFPKPIDVLNTSDSKLRSTGLSKMKIRYIKELSRKIERNELTINSISKLDDEEIIERLTQVKGIGQWTAEMFLIFSLGRLDVLPLNDLGLKKGIQQAFSLPELPEPKQMEKIAEGWKPYRSVATWYLWKSLQKFDSIG